VSSFRVRPVATLGAVPCWVATNTTQLRRADAGHWFAAVIWAAILAPATGARHRLTAIVGAAEFAPAACAGHRLATIVVAIARDRRAAATRPLLAAIGRVCGNRRRGEQSHKTEYSNDDLHAHFLVATAATPRRLATQPPAGRVTLLLIVVCGISVLPLRRS
jgi:hypothetical protein